MCRQISFSLLVLTLIANNCSDAAIIRLKSNATPTSNIVRLGDVADVYDANVTVAANLRQIVITPAPQAGSTMRLTFDQIRSRLRAHGISLNTTEFGGASVVLVSAVNPNPPRRTARQVGYRVTRPVNKWDHRRAEQYVGLAIAQQVKQFAPQLGAVDVDVTVDPQDAQVLLSGKIAGYDVRSIRPEMTNKYQTAAIGVFDRNEQRRAININYRIQPQPTVWSVNRVVGRGEIIQGSDLVQIPADKTKTGISRAEEIIGKEARRSLRPNQPIPTDAVRAIRLINVGDVVTATTRLNGIVVQRQMKAVSSGARGESVTLVSLPRGKERVFGLVTALREVEVGSARTPKITTTSNIAVRRIEPTDNRQSTRIQTAGGRQ